MGYFEINLESIMVKLNGMMSINKTYHNVLEIKGYHIKDTCTYVGIHLVI